MGIDTSAASNIHPSNLSLIKSKKRGPGRQLLRGLGFYWTQLLWPRSTFTNKNGPRVHCDFWKIQVEEGPIELQLQVFLLLLVSNEIVR